MTVFANGAGWVVVYVASAIVDFLALLMTD